MQAIVNLGKFSIIRITYGEKSVSAQVGNVAANSRTSGVSQAKRRGGDGAIACEKKARPEGPALNVFTTE